jgi:hypothetical protein
VQRCVLCFAYAILVLIAVDPALAADASESGRQPIGIFTDDNGQRILVGIGTPKPFATLDDSLGEIKIGSTGASCTAVLAGTLRYANSRLQLCDGADWRNVSLDKAE